MDFLSFIIAIISAPFLITNLFGFRFIGLTGGISTGKSTTTKILKSWGVPVIDFDQIARDVVLPGSKTLKVIAKEFGPDVLDANGALDRVKLGKLIFDDASKRRKLNAIMQRPIMIKFALEAAKLFFLGPVTSRRALLSGEAGESLCPGLLHSLGGSRVVVLDVPLLFESGIDKLCSETVFVGADSSQQLSRLMARDGINEQEAQKKITAQMSNAVKRARATATIENDGSQSQLQRRTAAWLRSALSRMRVWNSHSALATSKREADDESADVAAPSAAEYREEFSRHVPAWWTLALPWKWSTVPSAPATLVAALAALPCYFMVLFGERLLSGQASKTV